MTNVGTLAGCWPEHSEQAGPDKGSGVVGSALGCQQQLGPHSQLVCPQHAWIVDEKILTLILIRNEKLWRQVLRCTINISSISKFFLWSADLELNI